MTYQRQLQALIDEYIDTVDKNNILNLRILIPGFPGDLLISTDKQFPGRIEPSSYSELCLLISFKVQSKKSKAFLNLINQTQCLVDFKQLDYKNRVEFIKKTSNNTDDIVGTVNRIIENLFPKINYDQIQIDLTRIHGWHRLEDK